MDKIEGKLDVKTLREALDADGNDQIECPVCGDQIRAYKLGSDHAHPRQLLMLVEFLLSQTSDEAVDEERLKQGYQRHADRYAGADPDDSS